MAAAPAAQALTAPSAFSALLKRSRFASFDPAILQSYSAPPEYAHRGNYGLKRPLPARMRKRDKYIAIPAPFDSHAQYTAWDNAESEVRFVKRFEEMQVEPQVEVGTPWWTYAGDKQFTRPLFDSDFAEPYEGAAYEESLAAKAYAAAEATGTLPPSADALAELDSSVEQSGENTEQSQTSEAEPTPSIFEQTIPGPRTTTALNGFGNAGKGRYGAKRETARDSTAVAPNIHAMTPKEFNRYIERLRKLRPQFEEFVDGVRKSGGHKAARLEGKPLYQVATHHSGQYHRQFLYSHTTSQFQDPESKKIEPRPHRNGALIYPTLPIIHSVIYSKTQPGIVLHEFGNNDMASWSVKEFHGQTTRRNLLASYAGMSVGIPEHEVRNNSKQALFNLNDQAASLDRERIRPSILKMRPRPDRVQLQRPPVVVGKRERLRDGKVSLLMEVTADSYAKHLKGSNPNFPGTVQYMGHADAHTPDGPKLTDMMMRSSNAQRSKYVKPHHMPKQRGGAVPGDSVILDRLHNLLGQKSARPAR